MDLTSSKAGIRLMRYLSLAVMVLALAMASGCESSEEATTEEELKPPEEQSSDQQALTSFIGEKPKEEKVEAPAPVDSAAMMPPAPTLEAQLEELRTENTSLKQKIVKLEQDNRSLNARISDTETKLMAEKQRADKAEEAAKNAAKSGMTRGANLAEPPPAAPVAVSASAYDHALQTFRNRKYDDAIASFQALLDGGISPDLADNCTYWIGESKFGKRDYNGAIKSFEQVFDYKKSEKFADAQYMIARSLQALGERAKAKEAYEKVVKDFPTSRLVAKAKRRSANL